MKTFRLDFDIDAWIRNLEIEADSEEEALEKLYKMDLSEILEEGGQVHSADTRNEEVECIEADYKVAVKNIEYDVDECDVEDTGLTVEQVIATLPTELEIDIHWEESDDIEDLIVDELSDKTGYMIADYTYIILNK